MKFESVKKFVVANYKILIPIILMLVIFLAFVIYYLVSRVFTYSTVETGSYYQYFGSEKIIYDAQITKDKNGVITKIEPVDQYVGYDSTPMYDTSSDIVIFPSDMSVVAPIVNCSEYLTKSYSYVLYENSRYSLITKNYHQYLGHYFFYDGKDLYFFIEDFTLVIGNTSYDLKPFSYVIFDDGMVTYYDKENDAITSLSADSATTYVKNDYYTVYIGADYIDFSGQRVILTEDVSYLSTIDEMKGVTNE